eukprot:TRINITY_DN7288_c0_g2_i1.p1 TRINITY_DN7288_c0_g2~~TRINITY_DN7288_c0_g2_i1.p1  ORF type:complete len:794 (+),score=128.31 TRINITY_DN7288_c0_g2_i1:103-2484(+)
MEQPLQSLCRASQQSIDRGHLDVLLEELTEGLKQVNNCVLKLEKLSRGQQESVLPAEILTQIDTLFHKIDDSGDGQLSKDEAVKFFHRQGGGISVAEFFKAMDTDGDGSLGLLEWRKAWEELVTTGRTKKEDIASWLEAINSDSDEHMAEVPRFLLRSFVQAREELQGADMDNAVRMILRPVIEASSKNLAARRTARQSMKLAISESSAQDEESDKLQNETGFKALHPHSNKRLLWDGLSSLAVVVDIMLLPITLCISNIIFSETIDKAVSLITATFWTCDVGMSCVTGYVEGSEVKLDVRQVVRHYLGSWFVLDILILLVEWPTVIFDLESSLSHGQQAMRSSRVFRFARMVRVIRLVKLQQAMGKLETVTTSIRVHTAFAILKLSLTLGLTVHFLACGWYATGFSNATGWVWVGDRAVHTEDTATKYIASVRWTLAQINGRTDQESKPMLEMLYTAVCAVFAIMFMSYFVGSMTTRLMDIQKLLAKEKSMLQVLHSYNDSHCLSKDTVRMCKSYMSDQLSYETDADAERSLLQLLPPDAQADLLFEVRATCMGHHPFWSILVARYFHAVRAIIIEATSLNMTRRLETVFERGGLRDQMIFIDSGNLVYSRQGKLKAVLLKKFRTEEEAANMLKNKIMRFIRSVRKRRTSQLFSGGTSLVESSWLSEAALWARSWAARGDLISQTHSKLICIRSNEMIRVIRGYEEMLHITSYYARCFMRHVQDLIENEEDSDIMHVDLEELLDLSDSKQQCPQNDGARQTVKGATDLTGPFDLDIVPAALQETSEHCKTSL